MKIHTIIFVVLTFVAIPSSFSQPLDRTKRPTAAAAPVIKLGKAASFTLENGLKVFVVENHKLPKVSFQLTLDYDSYTEGDLTGVADIATDLMKTGTTSRTKEQLDKEIDQMGATLNFFATGFYATSLKKHSGKLADIITDILYNAKFSSEEFEKIKKKNLSYIASRKESPNEIASQTSGIAVYGKDHPYGEFISEATLNKIKLEDCEQFFKQYFRPNIAYLAIVGDITLAEAQAMMQEKFAKWEKKDVPTFTAKPVSPPAQTGVVLVDRPASVQSAISITHPIDLKPGSPDDIPARVMSNILGGGASGRLFQNLREKHSYTYGAYSALRSDELVGTFSASAMVRNAVTDSAIMEFMAELHRISKEKVSETELNNSLSFLAGTFARGLENSQTIAGQAINIARYGLPEDYYQNYLKNLATVTADDVQRVAQKYVLPQNAHIVIVGKKEEIGGKLAQFGAIQEYDVEGNIVPPPAPEPEKVDITVAQLTEKFTNAIGGAANLKKILDYQVQMGMELNGQPIAATFTYKAPNLSRKDVKVQEFILNTKAFNGLVGKEKTPQEVRNITGTELEVLKLRSTLFYETQLSALKINHSITGFETVNGRKTYALSIDMPDGEKTVVNYDVETGLKLKEILRIPSPFGAITVTSYYDDYREVNGVKFPFKVKQRISDPVKGPQTLEFIVNSIRVNQKLKTKFFNL